MRPISCDTRPIRARHCQQNAQLFRVVYPRVVEEMAPDESLSIVEGECLQLGGGGVVYDSMAALPQKGDHPHSTMYQCSSGLNTPHMLQVRLQLKKFSGFKNKQFLSFSYYTLDTRDLAKASKRGGPPLFVGNFSLMWSKMC